jgi:hypothetical protein
MSFPLSRKPGSRKDLDRPWEAGDSIPLPEAIHRDGDSAWALWNELRDQQDARFADTAPLTQPPGLHGEEIAWAPTVPSRRWPKLGQGAREPQPLFTLDAAMLVARRNNRVCPRPQRWDQFTAMLPPRKTLRGFARPPVPATGAAWAVTPPLTKRLCFREQIEWAERTGVLEAAMAFMQSMSEEEWLHMGEE